MEVKGTVLVTDSGRGSALAVIRSLGSKGWRVVAADSDPRSPAFASRFCAQQVVYPDPLTAPEEAARCLYEATRREGVNLLIPITDEAIGTLNRSRDRFEWPCRIASEDKANLDRAANKSAMVDLAVQLGVPVPRTTVVHTIEEARQAAPALGWPIVLKPAVSRVYDPVRGVVDQYCVSYANSLEALEAWMRPLEGRTRVLLQEYCPGDGQGVEFLAYQGRPLAVFQHRRLAEVPLSGGVSAWRESVPLDPVLYGHASRIVEAMGWTGLIMVEFKVGQLPWFMEVNGRIWGSLPLAVHSGMDFPARLADLYLMGPPADSCPPATDYRVGVRSFNLELILKWIPAVLFGLTRHPYLPLPRKSRALAAALGLLSPRQKLDVGFLEDPRAGIAEGLKIIRKLSHKVLESFVSHRGAHV
jgi:predicted ATP-grasp superfamily ATP-dependent carboligase